MEEHTNKKAQTEKIFIKNLKSNYSYQNESILIKTILRGPGENIALFIIDKDQGLIEHAASSDALVYVLEGEIEFSIGGQKYNIVEGNILKLPAKIPHSLFAIEQAKMLLIIFS